MPNSGRASPLYTYREAPGVRAKLDALVATHPQCSDLWIGVTWIILRDPTKGTLIYGKTATFVFVTFDFMAIGIRTMEIYYSIIDQEDRLIEIIDVI